MPMMLRPSEALRETPPFTRTVVDFPAPVGAIAPEDLRPRSQLEEMPSAAVESPWVLVEAFAKMPMFSTESENCVRHALNGIRIDN